MRALWCLCLLFLGAILTDVGGVQSVSAQSSTATVGKVNLFGDFWDVVNFQGISPNSRTELRIFPQLVPQAGGIGGASQPDPVGGEITLSGDDLYHLNSTGDYHVMAIYTYNQEYRMQSQAGGNAKPYPIKFDSMGGFINFSLNTDGSLGISRGISNTEGAGGFAHQRMPACPQAPFLCTMQLNWPTAFRDTNYTATCTLGGAPGTVSWTEKTPASLTLSIQYLYQTTGKGEVDCIGVHD
jgi:hypothetical protein